MIKLSEIFKNIETQIHQLPDKLNFKISEVASVSNLAQHVLRYWEKRFPILKPKKFINNQRLYSKADIEILFLIKYLLYEEKFSIEGLRKHLPFYYRQFKNKKPHQDPLIISSQKKASQLLNSIAQFRAEIK